MRRSIKAFGPISRTLNGVSRQSSRRAVLVAFLLIPILAIAAPNFNRHATAASEKSGSRQPAQTRYPGRVPGLVAQSAYLGSLPSEEPMHMTIAFEPREAAAMPKEISDIYNPLSPRFHQWLSPEQFGERYGRSADEIGRATGWLLAQGFSIDQSWPNKLAISFTGKSADVERAFQVTMGRYRDARQGRAFFSNDVDAVMPPELQGITAELRGLDNAYKYQTGKIDVRGPVTPDHIRRKLARDGAHVVKGSASFGEGFFMGPGDFQLAYNITDPATGKAVASPGRGQTAAIIIDSGLTIGDIDEYRAVLHLPAAKVKQITIPGVPTPPQSEDLETALDYGAISCIAPEAEIAIVLAPDLTYANVFAAEQYCVNTLMPAAVNESFGSCELESYSAAEQVLLEQGAAEGVAFCASAGDDSVQCFTNGFDSGIAMAQCPACYDAVTAVGGTQYAGQPVLNASGNLEGVSDEQVWNTPPGVRITCLGGGTPGASTGTGVSTMVSIPSYQSNAEFGPGGVPGGVSGRIVPDVAMSADPNSCGALGIIQGEEFIVGGTSESSPVMVGLVTLLNQAKGSRLGSPNAELYRLGTGQFRDSGPAVFVDITTGNNSSPAIPCFPNGIMGQSAGPGFDMATGWGALDYGQLVSFYGASSLPKRPAPTPPVIGQLSARLAGDILSLAVVSTSQGLDVSQATYQLFDNTGAALGQPFTFNISVRHSVLAAYFLNIPGLSMAPSAVSVSLAINDQNGGASGSVMANFAGADPGGPDIVSAVFDGSALTVHGKRMTGNLNLEINGMIVAAHSNSSNATATFAGDASELNLQPGTNRVRVGRGIGSDLIYSNIFLLSN